MRCWMDWRGLRWDCSGRRYTQNKDSIFKGRVYVYISSQRSETVVMGHHDILRFLKVRLCARLPPAMEPVPRKGI